VKGTITYGGKPVNGCALVLYPTGGAAGEGNPTLIPVTQQGTFQSGDVNPGEYKIVVQPTTVNPKMYSTKDLPPAKAAEAKAKIEGLQVIPTIKIPDKYKDRLKTDLKCNITKGDQTLPLELKD